MLFQVLAINIKIMENKVAEIKVSYFNNTSEKIKITGSLKAFQVLLGSWNIDTLELQEEFKILMLNYANEVLGVYNLSKGGVSGTVVDIKLLFAVALKCHASNIIIAHNHPSGTLIPSESDKTITAKIKKASELLDIKLIDHLIVTKEGYYSFSEFGLLS
ncbi:putative DNA repair protein [Flavobacterium beibuense]|uniref:Putative DNA repair protein n=2 Tax=Flavobacterium beibuense TaxID=657326 RepID=A0A444W6T8_9FLAO|nr:putative DNA repair protein [Flavobacterium beibuense]